VPFLKKRYGEGYFSREQPAELPSVDFMPEGFYMVSAIGEPLGTSHDPRDPSPPETPYVLSFIEYPSGRGIHL